MVIASAMFDERFPGEENDQQWCDAMMTLEEVIKHHVAASPRWPPRDGGQQDGAPH
jgi:hypothetical protein